MNKKIFTIVVLCVILIISITGILLLTSINHEKSIEYWVQYQKIESQHSIEITRTSTSSLTTPIIDTIEMEIITIDQESIIINNKEDSQSHKVLGGLINITFDSIIDNIMINITTNFSMDSLIIINQEDHFYKYINEINAWYLIINAKDSNEIYYPNDILRVNYIDKTSINYIFNITNYIGDLSFNNLTFYSIIEPSETLNFNLIEIGKNGTWRKGETINIDCPLTYYLLVMNHDICIQYFDFHIIYLK